MRRHRNSFRPVVLRRSEYATLIKIANKLWDFDRTNPHIPRLLHLSLVDVVTRREEHDMGSHTWIGRWVDSAELTGRGIRLLAGEIPLKIKNDRPRFKTVVLDEFAVIPDAVWKELQDGPKGESEAAN